MGKCGLGISVWDGARVIEAQVDGFSTKFLLYLYTLLVLLMDSLFAYSEAFLTVKLSFNDMEVKHFYLFVKNGCMTLF